ncbi:MAG: NADH-quinone oxidoreductase subunit NuoG [Bryobacteraceae bacterium]|nr:NADH-quinone oxidoreductase subunit NuoG [Bryobacteraceae bacterium]
MAKVYVDNRAFEMNEKQNLLHGCLSLGFDLPYFCWHPAMGSVGACRQCAVKQYKDENDTKGNIVMACMTPASDGIRISIRDPEAVEFRAAIIEGLMLNHPHDCPVCDEGGECHLQDMTVMTGHDYRRYRFEKRTFRNQYLGPFVHHEMNRCIQCYRCVRFYREYAGGEDLNVFSLRNTAFFGRESDGVLESEFAGNLVEVCPTGVFTDATLKRHYTRKWDLQMAPSICVHCGLGCNVTAGERYGVLRRVVNRYHSEINGYFLCDRGRYGYEFVNSDRRIRQPLLTGQPVTPEAARGSLNAAVSAGRAIGIGSPRASLESNFALRTLVGEENFYAGIQDDQHRVLSLIVDVLRSRPAQVTSLADVEASDAVLVLGEDLTNTAPRMALSLRQSVRQKPNRVAEKLRIPLWLDHAVREAVQNDRGPLFIATPAPTRLDNAATRTWRAAPDDIARLGFAVAHALNPDAPDAPGLEESERALAGEIAAALRDAGRPLVVAGSSLNSTALIQATANIAKARDAAGGRAGIVFTAPEPNSIGLALMNPKPLEEAFAQAAGTVIVLENDLYLRAPAATVDGFLRQAENVIALDHLINRTVEQAGLVLPAATYAEGDGTFVNNELRAQRFFRVLAPVDGVRDSWRWLATSWSVLDEVVAAIGESMPELQRIREVAPSAAFRIAGEKIPRAPERYSGRTAMLANIDVSEPKPPEDADSALAFSMEGTGKQPPPSLLPYFWSPGWNSIQSVNKYQEEIAGPLRGGPAGVRLIEDGDGTAAKYFGPAPDAFRPREGAWLLVPLHHIFGSDELSRHAPAVRELSADAYLALSPADAAELEIAAGGELIVENFRAPIKIVTGMARGMVGVPVGIPPFDGLRLPMWSRLSKP